MPLRLVRRPKSPNWIIRGTIRRIRIEESTGTDNKKMRKNQSKRLKRSCSPSQSTVAELPLPSLKRH